MPYIPAAHRQELDGLIDNLALRLVTEAQKDDPGRAFAGLLNYTLTRLALHAVRRQFGPLRYWLLAMLTGVFQNIGQEFYRRLGGPYEDKQKAKSGDVDLFKEYLEEIEKI
jgi:hypothetical protein